MKLTILATGRCRDKNILALEAEYIKRLKPYAKLTLTELPHGKNTSSEALKLEEAKAQLAKIPTHACVVALDETGVSLSTAKFANKLQQSIDTGTKEMVFVIGGADGLHDQLKDRADLVLSLSAMTFPHQMVRPLLAEQIYRAMTLLAGHPYHRA